MNRKLILKAMRLALIGGAVWYVVDRNRTFEVWLRESPLVSGIGVNKVSGGVITLADGRAFAPAGIRKADGVSDEDYDLAVRVVMAQGVVVTRDLGDGRAFLMAEPRFYNSCGTRGFNGDPRARCAGIYQRCSASHVLVATGYGVPDAEQLGLTKTEERRLRAVATLFGDPAGPTPIAEKLLAFRNIGSERALGDDEFLGSVEIPTK